MLTFTFYSYSLLGNNIHFIHHDRNRLDHKPINSVLQLVGVQHVDFTSRPSVIHVWHYDSLNFKWTLGHGLKYGNVTSLCNAYLVDWPSLASEELKWSEVNLLRHVWLFETPWTIAHQAPPSVGFSWQEYRSGLPFPSPGDLPDPGIEPGSPAL